MQKTWVQFQGWEDPLEKEMATHSSTLAWRITTVACQAPLSIGCSRQEYWNGLLFPPPGDPPHPGIELAYLPSPALAGRFFTTSVSQEALKLG